MADNKMKAKYQEYLAKVGLNKNAMTYYQWKNKGKEPLKRKKKEPMRNLQRKSLESALSPEEIKRLGG